MYGKTIGAAVVILAALATASPASAEKMTMKLNLNGAAAIAPWLRDQLYTRTAHKRVPAVVLNAGGDSHDAFLAGYYAGDATAPDFFIEGSVQSRAGENILTFIVLAVKPGPGGAATRGAVSSSTRCGRT